MFLLKRVYFNKTYIIKGLCIALLFSSPIYLSYFGIENKLLNTITVLCSLYFILKEDRITTFYIGFFIGFYWFYWISFSFIYYDLNYLVPIIIFLFSLIYGLLFLLITIKKNIYLKAILLFGLSFLEPFGFNWFKIELLLLDTYFDISKFILLALIISSILLIKKRYIIYGLSLIFISMINLNENTKIESTNLKISLPAYNFEQNYKWDKKNLASIVDFNFENINIAIKDNYDVVVLPETTFPLLLNKQKYILEDLLELSHKITIITGGLFYENDEYKNSTYIFKNGNLKIANKVVLVPFGEAVPLPQKIRNLINDIFYDGAKDYTKADKPTDYKVNDTLFRNAICYEATSEEIYKNLGQVKNIIAISNNAWFTPSIEPTLQKLLLRLYSKKYGLRIYHQINGSENYIINP